MVRKTGKIGARSPRGSELRPVCAGRPLRSSEPALGTVRPFFTRTSWNAVLCLLLAVATLAIYSPVSEHAFLTFDDHDYVTANPHVRDGLRWTTVRWAFTATAAANWHPLTWLSHALDCQLFGLNPAGHHLDSVLIHTVDALLLLLLLTWITKRRGPSLLVAALFALHPINVESVAWVAERKNVLSTLFFFLAIGAYVRYAQKPDWRRYLLIAALFAAGLMAKPMVITLPFVLLLLDYWPLGRTPGGAPSAVKASQRPISKLLLEKLPLLFLSALSAVITVKAQRSGQAVRSLSQFPLAVRIENALVAYADYLWKMLWPTRLAPLYPHPGDTLPFWQVAFAALVLVTLTALVIVFRQRRYLLVGWLWFLGTLVPVLGLVQVGDAAMADRYAYVPLIGIFVMTAWGLDDLAEAKRIPEAWRVIPALCVLAALSLITSRQLDYWNNEFTLWSHTLAVTDRNPFAHDAMGSALLEPEMAIALSHQENLDTEQKRMNEARQQYEDALQIRQDLAKRNPATYLPDMASTLNNLGNLDRLQKQTDVAYPHFEEALKIYHQLVQQNPDIYLPDMAMTLNNLAISEKDQNRLDEARQHYEETLKVRRGLVQQSPQTYLPDVAMTLNDLGNLDGIQNRPKEARQHYEESLKVYRQLSELEPQKYRIYVAGTLNNLGFLSKNQSRIEESRAYYTEALAIYREFAQGESGRYASDVARVEASLVELGKVSSP